MGCFTSTLNQTNLPEDTMNSTSMTYDLCFTHCTSLHMPIAGILEGQWCLCAPDVEFVVEYQFDIRPESECDILCPGYKNQQCGGTNARISAFSLRSEYMMFTPVMKILSYYVVRFYSTHLQEIIWAYQMINFD